MHIPAIWPLFEKKPDLVIRETRTHLTQTRMSPDKNPTSKGVEARTSRLIVDAAETLIRQNDTIEAIEIHVDFDDRSEHPKLLMDLCKIMHDTQSELTARIGDISVRILHLFVMEVGGGKIIADLELTKEDIGA